jgi:hypothetical protein
LAAKEGAADTVTRRPSAAAVSWLAASASRSNASRKAGRAVWAASVSSNPLGVLRNREAPM